MNLNEWIRDQRHLPKFLRDFHDQKDVFKALSDWRAECRKRGDRTSIDEHLEVSWVNGMCFVIDWFLKFMAFHGYTLQRSQAGYSFHDIRKTIEQFNEREIEALRGILERKDTP